MKQFSLICFVILLCACSMLAQSGNSDRCEVGVVNVSTSKVTMLGTFTTVIAEEEATTRAFLLPGTKLYIVASVFYTDESMASEKSSSSVSLELAVSRGRKRDVLQSISWAEAEMPLNTFDVGRVTMLVKLSRRPQLVVMECRKNVRR